MNNIMRIAQFFDLISAQNKLTTYNALAISPTSSLPFELTTIYQHITEPIWWFNVDDCINNGGINKDTISSDVLNLNIININQEDLISQNYLENPINEIHP